MNANKSGDTKTQVVDLDITAFYQFEMDYLASQERANPAFSKFAVYFNNQLLADRLRCYST